MSRPSNRKIILLIALAVLVSSASASVSIVDWVSKQDSSVSLSATLTKSIDVVQRLSGLKHGDWERLAK